MHSTKSKPVAKTYRSKHICGHTGFVHTHDDHSFLAVSWHVYLTMFVAQHTPGTHADVTAGLCLPWRLFVFLIFLFLLEGAMMLMMVCNAPGQGHEIFTPHDNIGEVLAGLQCPTCQPASQNVVQLDSGLGPSAVARAGHGVVLDCTSAWHQVQCCPLQVSQPVSIVNAIQPLLITLHMIAHAVAQIVSATLLPEGACLFH